MKITLRTLRVLASLMAVALITGCVDMKLGAGKTRVLTSPPAPFAVREVVKAVPELRENKIMLGDCAAKPLTQYAFVCGDNMLYAEPGERAANFVLTMNRLPFTSLSYWGSTKAGWGHPFNSSTPELTIDQAAKSIAVTRKFEALAKDDSTFTGRMKLLEDGLIEVDYSCAMPAGGKLTDQGILVSFNPYSKIAGMKILVGDKQVAFSPDDAPHGDKTLFEGEFSGRIVFSPDHPERSFAIEVPDKRQIYIKEFRKEADKGNMHKYMGQIRIWPDQNGALKLRIDIRSVSSEALKTADSFAGINFWKNDRLHIPDFSARSNLLQNSSFESDLRYYDDGVMIWGSWPGTDRKVYAIDDKTAKFGNRSLLATTWKDYPSPTALSTFTIPTVAGKKYTFSFYAKADGPKLHIDVGCVTAEWLKFPSLPGFSPSLEWKRYSGTFTAPNSAAIIVFRPRNTGDKDIGHVWMDGLQLEEGDKATDYIESPISVVLLTSAPGNFFAPGQPMDARIRIHAAPNTKGSAAWEVEDFLYAKPCSGKFNFATDETGDATTSIPIDGKLGTGIFVVRTDVKTENGSSNTEFNRIYVMSPAPENCAHKSIFATTMRMTSHSEATAARLAYLGFGSANYETVKDRNSLLEKYGMPNIGGSGVVGYGPGDYSTNSVESRAGLIKRVTTEPYSDSLRVETENVSCQMAKAYPWIRTWFLQAEIGGGKIKCAEDKDADGLVKLILACRAGILKADPTLGFIFEGGYPNMYPEGGTATEDKWLAAAERVAPDIRFDKFAVHPYRPTPESPDLDANTETFISMLARHGYTKEPIYWNEGIYNCPWNIPEWGLDVHRGCSTDHWRAGTPTYHMGWAERVSAAYYARSYLVALKYSDRVRQFNGWNSGYTFIDVEMGVYALAKVPNTLGRLLGDSKFNKDIRFAVNCRAYVFEDALGRPVAAVWSHFPNVDRGVDPSPVAKMRFSGKIPEFIDLMENNLQPVIDANGFAEVPVTPFPTFIRGKAGTFDSLCKTLSSAVISGSKEFPLVVDMKLKSTTSAELSFFNRISRKFEGVATVGPRKIELAIPENSSKAFDLPLEKAVPCDSIGLVSIPLEITENGGAIVGKDYSFHAFAVAKSKGKADAWEGIPWISLTNRQVYKSAGSCAAVPVNFKAGYAGDMEAEFKLRWDEEKLHLLVKVVDDKPFFPKSSAVPAGDWSYDSIQIYIDTLGDNANRKTKGIFDFNDYSYCVSRDVETGKARVYRHSAPEQQIAGGLVAPMPNMIEPDVAAVVTTTPDGYIYDLSFPRRLIAPLELRKGSFARFGLMVNDNDGEGRKGGLVNTASPGSEPYANPEQWPGILLVE